MRRSTLFALLAIFILLASPLSAEAQTDPTQLTLAANALDRASYLTLSAADFRPTALRYVFTNTGQYLKVFSVAEGPAQFIAPVNLPSGSVIRKLTLKFNDTIFGHTMTARLYARAGITGELTELASLTNTLSHVVTPTDPYDYQTSTGALSIQCAPSTAYFIVVTMPLSSEDGKNANWLNAITIDYDLPDRLSPTDIYAVTPGAMIPFKWGYDFTVQQGKLRHLLIAEPYQVANGSYQVKLNLPHGASIFGFSMLYNTHTTQPAVARLQYSNRAQLDWQTIATVTAKTGNLDNQTTFTPVHANTLVDNDTRSYWINLDLPPAVGADYFEVMALFVFYAQPAQPSAEQITVLSAAQFVPGGNDYIWQNHARFLRHTSRWGSSPSTYGDYLATLHLPHGAALTSITVDAYDTLPNTSAFLMLWRDLPGLNPLDLIWRPMTTDTGFQSFTVSNLTGEKFVIDHSKYSYYAVVNFPPSTVSGDPSANDVLLSAVEVRYNYTFTNVYRAFLPNVSNP